PPKAHAILAQRDREGLGVSSVHLFRRGELPKVPLPASEPHRISTLRLTLMLAHSWCPTLLRFGHAPRFGHGGPVEFLHRNVPTLLHPLGNHGEREEKYARPVHIDGWIATVLILDGH